MSPQADTQPIALDDVVSHVLAPGSSLHPTFLLIVDSVFGLLLLVLIVLAFITRGNLHFFLLIAITLGLWVSVKWFVNELKHNPAQNDATDGEGKKEI